LPALFIDLRLKPVEPLNNFVDPLSQAAETGLYQLNDLFESVVYPFRECIYPILNAGYVRL